jgi:uncharacterized protein (TIGR02996 family)
MGVLRDELESRFGDQLAEDQLDWRDDELIGLSTYDLDIARAVLASPAAARLERLFLGDELDAAFGEARYVSSLPHAPLDELLARVPRASIVHASAGTIAIGSHDQVERLTLVTRAWPLAGVVLPALRRLEVCITETETAVAREQLAGALRAHPRLSQLVLRGTGFAALVAELATFAYPAGLELVVDVPIDAATALALVERPGTLAALSRLELPSKTDANRLVLNGLEQAIPLATHGHVLTSVTRWPLVERACAGPIDPALRIWEWQTREEGRSTGWVGFLPRRASTPVSPRESDLVRAAEAGEPGAIAVYADWLEERGQLERAMRVRTDGLPFVPRSLPEATAILACAWKRISSGGWIRDRAAGTIDPLADEDFAAYVGMFSYDEHPLAPRPSHTLAPNVFDDRVTWLLTMMRGPPAATLLENEWRVRDDVATFTPPIGPARAAIRLRDAWNDMLLTAETAGGYAMLIWGTGA